MNNRYYRVRYDLYIAVREYTNKGRAKTTYNYFNSYYNINECKLDAYRYSNRLFKKPFEIKEVLL